MATRRAFLRAAIGGACLLSGGLRAASADPLSAIQARLNGYCGQALANSGANVAVVAGVVTPEINGGTGEMLYARGAQLTNPFGEPLSLDERTPFEIGSISKVFSSGIYYMLHGPYSGTLGSHMPAMGMSRAVADLRLVNLAIYQPGLAQDNQGGVYPRWILENLETLFRYLGSYNPPYPRAAAMPIPISAGLCWPWPRSVSTAASRARCLRPMPGSWPPFAANLQRARPASSHPS